MKLISQLIISLIITAIASTLTSMMLEGKTIQFLNLPLTIAFFVATAATAIIVSSMASPAGADTGQAPGDMPSAEGARERGDRQVVQCIQGIWIHHQGRRRRDFCALSLDSG